jgi:hypothetical protein
MTHFHIQPSWRQTVCNHLETLLVHMPAVPCIFKLAAKLKVGCTLAAIMKTAVSRLH